MSERSNTERALDVLEGACVRKITVNAAGYLFIELAHRGCDDDGCEIRVAPDAIGFWYPESATR